MRSQLFFRECLSSRAHTVAFARGVLVRALRLSVFRECLSSRAHTVGFVRSVLARALTAV